MILQIMQLLKLYKINTFLFCLKISKPHNGCVCMYRCVYTHTYIEKSNDSMTLQARIAATVTFSS